VHENKYIYMWKIKIKKYEEIKTGKRKEDRKEKRKE
jgi:hypothetical protein